MNKKNQPRINTNKLKCQALIFQFIFRKVEDYLLVDSLNYKAFLMLSRNTHISRMKTRSLCFYKRIEFDMVIQ